MFYTLNNSIVSKLQFTVVSSNHQNDLSPPPPGYSVQKLVFLQSNFYIQQSVVALIVKMHTKQSAADFELGDARVAKLRSVCPEQQMPTSFI